MSTLDISTLTTESSKGTTQPITPDILDMILNVGHIYMMGRPPGEREEEQEEEEDLSQELFVVQDSNEPLGGSPGGLPSTQPETAGTERHQSETGSIRSRGMADDAGDEDSAHDETRPRTTSDDRPPLRHTYEREGSYDDDYGDEGGRRHCGLMRLVPEPRMARGT